MKDGQGLKVHTSNTPPALSTVRPHLVEGAVSSVYGIRLTTPRQNANKAELTIFFSFSSASVHSPLRVTAYIPNPSAAAPTMSLLIILFLRSIELGECFADRAPVRSERGASSAAVKSSVERLGSSESFGSETSPGAAGGCSEAEESALSGSLEGLEEDCDEAAGWLSDDSC